MRDKIYLVGFLIAAGILLYLGHDLVRGNVIVAWGLTFAGTATAAVLVVVVYRFRTELEASRLELARKEAELSFAHKVQQALFPHQLPSGKGLEISATCVPARGISGDYYDVLELPGGSVALAIADISGKGISAAILMANLQALLRVLSPLASSPSDICSQLNHHLYKVTENTRFATLFYGEWHPQERRFRYVNAGHNPPFLLSGNGTLQLDRGGIPLGIMPASDYEIGEVRLQPGDVLVLYSDGITEAGLSEEKEFGTRRLSELVASCRGCAPAEIQARVMEAVKAWWEKEPEDDMTLVVARVMAQAEVP